jgi:TPR repeat protein
MKTVLTALLAICVCLVIGCGEKTMDFESLKALAEKEDAKAQTNLGLMYETGEGVEKDDKEAVKWYRKAAEQGEHAAQFNLGQMYRNGIGVPKDIVTAYTWHNIAAANGNESGKHLKDTITKKMTAEQITKADELFKEMIKKNPKLILDEE